MKITDIDKRQAIKRLPAFKKDYSRYNKLKTEDKTTRFKIDFLKKWGYEFDGILRVDDVVKNRRRNRKTHILQDMPKDTPTVEVVYRINEMPYIYVYAGEEKTPTALSGNCLYLKVTLKGKTETQLVEDFIDTIKPYRNLLKAQLPAEAEDKRNRKTDIIKGIWSVYDLYLETGKNMSETTRQLFEVSGNPVPLPDPEKGEYDEKLFKRTKKAVTNAEVIINAVGKEYELKS
jgi:hypothetical protein